MGLLDWWSSKQAPSYVEPMLADIAGMTDEQRLYALSQDRSGWWREAAMRRAIALNIARLLALLAARLNDHIQSIGDLARSEMLARAAEAPAAQLLEVLPDVLRLHAAGRQDHSGWLGQFESLLFNRMGLDALRTAVMTAAAPVARACFDVLRRHGALDEPLIAHVLAASADLVVLRAALLEVPAPSDEALTRRWLTATRSKLGPIRVLGTRRLLAGGSAGLADPAREGYAVAALLDAQAAVRASAAAYLAGRQFDVVGHYRTVLTDRTASVKHQVAALSGLEALRASAELPLIRRLDFASPRTRRAALKAWIKLADVEKDEVALIALRDPAPGVRRFAYTAVSRYGAYIPDELVFATLRPDVDGEAYRAFAERDRWQWLIYLGDAAARSGPHDPGWKRLRHDVLRWTYDPDTYTRPLPHQAQRLADPMLHEQLERVAMGDENCLRRLRDELASLR